MKIRDLDKGRYIVVYDMGKSEYSECMTVVGQVVELIFNDEDDNAAIIQSMPYQRYTVTDDNYFDYWNDYMESKTESLSKVRIKDLNLGDVVQIENGLVPLRGEVTSKTDLLALVHLPSVGYRCIGDESDFKRIRKASKPLDYVKCMEKNIEDSQKYIDEVKSNDVQQRKRGELNISVGMKTVPSDTNDTVNKPSHYTYGKIETIEIVEQVTATYPVKIAFSIGNSLKYICRAPFKNGVEDLKKAVWYLNRAIKNWDVK